MIKTEATAVQAKRAERVLQGVAVLPTAAGREGRVVDQIERWAAKRRDAVTLRADAHGNLTVRRKGVRASAKRRPIYFTAHLDHPAFVVRSVDGDVVTAEFRGGVRESYFVGARVRVWPAKGKAVEGEVVSYTPAGGGEWVPVVEAKMDASVARRVRAGDVMVWALDGYEVVDGIAHTPACDDLAAVAAALAAYERCLKLVEAVDGPGPDVRLLFTRAEEVGFIGAIGAAKDGTVPGDARLICLENSKAWAGAPIGGGPVVRVGDKTSTFTPELTFAVGQVAAALAKEDEGFTWQRKLMDGGTCEASAFHAMGYAATCVCLPLGHYHNMDEANGTIAREHIALSDYHGLVRLLVSTAFHLDDEALAVPLVERLEGLFAARGGVLGGHAG